MRKFPMSASKLEDCRTNLKAMKAARNSLEFRAGFTSFLSSARAITYVLQKEGAHIIGFGDWYASKQNDMKNDPLLKFIHKARTEDFHEGKPNLRFGTHIDHFSTNDVKPTAAPIEIGVDGIFQIADKGTPKERRIPIESGKYRIAISIENPPTEHLGKMINDTSPVNICELSLQYFESIIYEANKAFNSK
ncbi:MAG: hypothetical protein PHR43_04350 [Dehalococcoidales bacterium]|nr:hypothetical protein [Dehalococcoidales bacterium]